MKRSQIIVRARCRKYNGSRPFVPIRAEPIITWLPSGGSFSNVPDLKSVLWVKIIGFRHFRVATIHFGFLGAQYMLFIQVFSSLSSQVISSLDLLLAPIVGSRMRDEHLDVTQDFGNDNKYTQSGSSYESRILRTVCRILEIQTLSSARMKCISQKSIIIRIFHPPRCSDTLDQSCFLWNRWCFWIPHRGEFCTTHASPRADILHRFESKLKLSLIMKIFLSLTKEVQKLCVDVHDEVLHVRWI